MSIKYLDPETEILLFNGDIKKIKNLIEEDILLGKFAENVKIQKIEKEKDKMYIIIPHLASCVKVGSKHQLFSISYDNFDIKNVPVNEYSTFDFHKFFLTKTKTNFPYQKIRIDPYFIGIYIANDFSFKFNKKDKYITKFLLAFIKKFAFQYLESEDEIEIKDIRLLNIIEYYNVNETIIPTEFLFNSLKVRFKLLAGILDYKSGYNICKECFELEIEEGNLEKICFLINSAGFFTTIHHKEKKIYKINIYGEDISDIPLLTRKKNFDDSIVRCYFKLCKRLENEEECVKLELDSDSIVLKDFTII